MPPSLAHSASRLRSSRSREQLVISLHRSVAAGKERLASRGTIRNKAVSTITFAGINVPLALSPYVQDHCRWTRVQVRLWCIALAASVIVTLAVLLTHSESSAARKVELAAVRAAQANQRLLAAIADDDLSAAREAIAGGASPDATDDDDERAVTKCIVGDRIEILRLFQEQGLLAGNRRDYALRTACLIGNPKAVRLLLSSRDPLPGLSEALVIAGGGGHSEILALLLAHGADPNSIAGNSTALLEAAARGHVEVVQILLRNHADFRIRDDHQRTALQRAIEGKYVAIIKLLRRSGASI